MALNLNLKQLISTRLILAIVITTQVLATSVVLADELPELGDISQTVLSPQQEQAIAEQILPNISRIWLTHYP